MMERLSKLSTPVKIGAGAGLLLIVVVFAFTVLKPHSAKTTAVTAAPLAAPVAKPTAADKLQLAPGLPPALRVALRAHGVVVAVLSDSRKSVLITTARQAAKSAHAGFAVLNVGNESIARDVATLVPGVSISTVVVFRRPGTVAVALPGYTDSDTVAQAAVDSRNPPVVTTPSAETAAPVTTTTP